MGKNTHTINLYLTILLFMVDISFSKASILLSKLCTELCISGLGVSGLVPESEKKFQVSFPWKSIRKIWMSKVTTKWRNTDHSHFNFKRKCLKHYLTSANAGVKGLGLCKMRTFVGNRYFSDFRNDNWSIWLMWVNRPFFVRHAAFKFRLDRDLVTQSIFPAKIQPETKIVKG